MFWIIFLFAFLSFSVALGVIILSVLNEVSSLRGAPFVPTTGGEIKEILERVRLRKGQVFLELGSGDGRVVRSAVKLFGVSGIGVDIHPMLIWYSRWRTWRQKLKGIKFVRKNVYKFPLKGVDVIYLFLMPKMLVKLQDRMLKECQSGTLVIAHGFEVPALKKLEFDRISSTYFPTYYYRIK